MDRCESPSGRPHSIDVLPHRAAACLFLLGAASAIAQISPLGPQFQVNTYTPGFQLQADVAVDEQGNIVVVWYSGGAVGQDMDGSVQGQRFDSVGAPLGTEFQINSYSTGEQWLPAVAALSNGGFVVVWRSAGSSGTDSDLSSIQAQRFGADGSPVGQEFQVNSDTAGVQWYPDVAGDAQGGFVVVWDSIDPGVHSNEVRGRVFSADGQPIGPEFPVAESPTPSQWRGRVDSSDDGFVVVWGVDNTGYDSIAARQFNALGTPTGNSFRVDTSSSGSPAGPDIAVDDSGKFVVAWSVNHATSRFVRARRFDGLGAPLSNEIDVAEVPLDVHFLGQSIAAESTGAFVVSWAEEPYSPPPGTLGLDGSPIRARRYDDSGYPVGPSFQVNAFTTGSQNDPAVAMGPTADFVVTWRSDGSPGADQLFSSVQARRFGGVFGDGFETGDVARWSHSVP